MLLNNQGTEWLRETKTKTKHLETMTTKAPIIKTGWNAETTVLREKFITMQSYLKRGKKKKSNKQLSVTPKATREWRANKI